MKFPHSCIRSVMGLGLCFCQLHAVELNINKRIGFEQPDYGIGNVHGQNGWEVTQGEVRVVSSVSHHGLASLELKPASPFSQAKISVKRREMSGVVSFVDLWILPVASPWAETGELLDIDGARIAFFSNPEKAEEAEFWVFHQTSPEDQGQWIKTGKKATVDAASKRTAGWVRLTMREDFARQVWDLSIDGQSAAANLGFYRSQASQEDGYIIMGDVNHSIFLDDLAFLETNPLGNDPDLDGILSSIEVQIGSNPNLDDRDETLPGRGSVLELAVADESRQAVFPAVPVPAAPVISLGSGFLDVPSPVSITAGHPDHKIVYTLDGSDPRKAGIRFEGAIQVAESVILKAASLGVDGKMSAVNTAAYVFPEQVAAQQRPANWPAILRDWSHYRETEIEAPLPVAFQPLESEVAQRLANAVRSCPAVSIVADVEGLFDLSSGLYARSSQPAVLAAKVESMSLEPGAPPVAGEGSAMISISGQSSRYHDTTLKHSFRVRLNPGSSPLAESLGLGGQAEKSLLLRHPTQDSWVVGSIWSNGRAQAKYVSDAFTASCLEDLGHPAMKRRFVNVFLNGKYWGAYEAMEQLAPRPDATALLEPGNASNSGKAQAIFGSASAWEQLCAELRKERQRARDGLVASEGGWDACMKRINVDNLIDYVLLNCWAANTDWINRNYLIWEKAGVFSFLSVDAEFVFRSPSLVEFNLFEALNEAVDGPVWAFAALAHHEGFRERVKSRGEFLFGGEGPWSIAFMQARWDAAAGGFEPFAALEAARWSWVYDAPPRTMEDWRKSVLEVRDHFIPQRHDVLGQDLEAYLSGARQRQALWVEAAAARRHLLEQERLAEEEYRRQRDAAGIPAVDRDGDGIPDEWELSHGFDPDNPEDAHALIEGTNLTAFDLFVGVTPESAAEAARSAVGHVYSPMSVRYLKGEWIPDPAFKSLFDSKN